MHVLSDQRAYLGSVTGNHEMRGVVYRGECRAAQELGEVGIRTLQRWMGSPTAEDEGGSFDRRQRGGRKREAISARPIKNIDGCHGYSVGAGAVRPGREGAGAPIEVDHRRDRLRVAAGKVG